MSTRPPDHRGRHCWADLGYADERAPAVDDAQWLTTGPRPRRSTRALAALVADSRGDHRCARRGSRLLSLTCPAAPGGWIGNPAAELLSRSRADTITAEVADRLVEATGGNPLALLELGPEAHRLHSAPYDNLPVTGQRRADLPQTRDRAVGGRAPRCLFCPASRPWTGRSPSRRGIHRPPGQTSSRPPRRWWPSAWACIELFILGARLLYHSASPADPQHQHLVALAGVMTGADD